MKKIKLLLLLAVIICLPCCIFHDKKEFEGIRIMFFAGGYPDDSFAPIVYAGAKKAEADFGCKVEGVFSNWSNDKMVNDFKEAIGKKPDAICIMGHPGDEILKPLVEEAFRKGIIVTSQNVELPEVEDKFFNNGFGYVGQDT